MMIITTLVSKENSMIIRQFLDAFLNKVNIEEIRELLMKIETAQGGLGTRNYTNFLNRLISQERKEIIN
jgi:hypothetical protein